MPVFHHARTLDNGEKREEAHFKFETASLDQNAIAVRS